MAELALTARSVAPRRIFSPLCHAEAPLLAGTCLVQPCLLAYFDVFLGFSGVLCGLCPERHPGPWLQLSLAVLYPKMTARLEHQVGWAAECRHQLVDISLLSPGVSRSHLFLPRLEVGTFADPT